MKATIKRLELRYFKGIKKLDLDLDEEQNFLHGANEAGKTTVFDAVWYLFFGKDSTGRADFSIKTFDPKTGEVIEKVEHIVRGVFDVDGLERVFERKYLEKWDKKTNTLKTHTSEFQIDGFPVATKSEFDQQINELFTEETFKLLTNPLYLYSGMKMADRRRIVATLAKPVDRDQVLADMVKSHPEHKKHLKELTDILQVQSNLEAIKLKVSRDKKALREEKDGIPDRIDENLRKIEEAELDWDGLESQLAEKNEAIKKLDEQIYDISNRAKSVNQEKLKLEDERYMADKRRNFFINEAKTQAEEANKDSGKDIQEAKDIIENLTKKLEGEKQQRETLVERLVNGKRSIHEQMDSIANHEKKREILLEEFKERKASKFQLTGDCPYCGTDLETVEEFSATKEKEFNNKKKQDLLDIVAQGKKHLESIEKSQAAIKKYQEAISNLEGHLKEAEANIDSFSSEINTLNDFVIEASNKKTEEKTFEEFLDPQYESIGKKITEIEVKIKSVQEKSTNQGLEDIKNEKAVISEEIRVIERQLDKRDNIKEINTRVQELKDRETELAAKITDMEGLENMVFEFNKACMDEMESEINSKFSLIHWKMFETQMNGEDKEICEAIYKGVPFPDLNTAGKIQAGIDIINAFSDEYGLYLPVFIDNRESITKIPECKSQVINLVVDPKVKKLTLNNQ